MLKKLTSTNSFWFFILLVGKENKAKYKSTMLGFLWAFINPLIQMFVLSLVFVIFIRLPIKNYPLFVFSALLPWTFFNLALLSGTYSLLENKDFLKKAHFNRLLIPISSITSNLINFLISLSLFMIYLFMFKAQLYPLNLLILLLAILLLIILITALVLLLSSLNLYYRDIYYLLQAALLAGFYISPIIYPSSFVPEPYKIIFNLNPLVGIISLFRASLINFSYFDQTALILSVSITISLLLIGFAIFKRREPYFTDWI